MTQKLSSFTSQKIYYIVQQTAAHVKTVPDLFDPLVEIPRFTSYELSKTEESLGSHKAAGPDGIQPYLQKMLFPFLSERVLGNYNACLSLGFYPTYWRHAAVVILPKRQIIL